MKETSSEKEKKIKVALIATYPEMTKRVMKIARERDIVVENYYASFEKAINIAKQIQHQVDAIITRGGTGQVIKENVDIPVVMIPITPFDLFCSIEKIDRNIKEVAFINFNRTLYGVEEIEKKFNIKINQLTFRKRSDIERNVNLMAAKGIGTIIGGNVAAEYAKKLGLNGIEITSGEEAIYSSLQELVAIVRARREEQEKAQRLSVAFNSISEGIIISDEKKKVFLCNTAAEKIFNVTEKDYSENKEVKNFVDEKNRARVYETHMPERNNLFKIKNVVANVSHIPIELEDEFIGVVSTIADVTRIQQLEGQIRNKLNEKGFFAKYEFCDIITDNQKMKDIKEIAKLYSATNSSILIEGESGTGKELFAQSMHNVSKFSKGPFVAINCAAIPENLLESELFGYEGGAFTGAKKDGKPGVFEMANNGTVFLDEIGEMPLPLQARLLRVLQEKEIMRVGGNKVIPINVRVISATNKNLHEKVLHGDFREDLYYRLNVFGIKIPALRERRSDIPILCKAFMEKFGVEYGIAEKELFESEMLPMLCRYDWPGNVRELENVMERLSFFLKGKLNTIQWTEMIPELARTENGVKSNGMILNAEINLDDDMKTAVSKVEKAIVEHLMKDYNNNQELVAHKLGIGKTTLWRKLNEKD